MDTTQLTPEEQKFEEEALRETKEEDVRNRVVEEFGFNPDTDKEKIDKLVSREIEQGQKLSKAIGQKRKYREQLQAVKPDDKKNDKGIGTPAEHAKPSDELSNEDLLTVIEAKIHRDDLSEIRAYARNNKITIAQTLEKPFIKSFIATQEEFRKSAQATNTGTRRASAPKTSPETLKSDLSKGKIPEPNSKESEELFFARRQKK